MRLFGIFLALLIAFGSLVPHAAPAHQHPVVAAHHMDKSHSSPPRDCTDCTTHCVGCAAPLKHVASPSAPSILPGVPRSRFIPGAPTAFIAPFELPPPRSIA